MRLGILSTVKIQKNFLFCVQIEIEEELDFSGLEQIIGFFVGIS